MTAHRVTAALLHAATRACDHWGDNDDTRAKMRAQCLGLPIHLQRVLLEHFEREYAQAPALARRAVCI